MTTKTHTGKTIWPGAKIGIVNDDVHVEEYDEILEAQLEWMRNTRGD